MRNRGARRAGIWSHYSTRGIAIFAVLSSILVSSLPSAASAVDTAPPGVPVGQPTSDDSEKVGDDIPEERRSEVLGSGWQSSDDVAWTLTGDSSGLSVLVADIGDGYRWRQVAKLSVGSFETDRWIGNACLTGDSRSLAVVFAPRSFANSDTLFERGAFAAVVNIATGTTTHLKGGVSLAYFNPGCGRGNHAIFTSYDGEKTRLLDVDTATTESREVLLERRIHSAIPVADGILGTDGASIVGIDATGSVTPVARTEGTPFQLTPTGDSGLTYLEHDGTSSRVLYIDAVHAKQATAPVELARGPLDKVGIAADAAGTAHVTGQPEALSTPAPASVTFQSNVGVGARFSSSGALAVEDTYSPSTQHGTANTQDSGTPVSINVVVPATDSDVTFSVPSEVTSGSSVPPSDGTSRMRGAFGTSRGGTPIKAETGSSPVSEGSICAVPRNDPRLQAMQPRPAEVEWAVDRAVRQTIDSDLPLPALSGGGRVPAQIMLGVLAQESNFWQASRYAVPGVLGNPLIGNYYGTDRGSADPDAWWQIDYQSADCGYGIAQVTTGMRTGEMALSLQEKIATDYKANIARGLQILIEKWNETRSAGLVINDGDPQYLENWFYALWAYNTGLHPQGAAVLPWGVGWSNNPINEIYPANRLPFLDGNPADAAQPQLWPYPERVLGFAAHSAQFLDSVDQTSLDDDFNYVSAFTPGWWPSSDGAQGVNNRKSVKPPITLFCDASNDCNPSNLSSPCSLADSRCWFHKPATWKTSCSSTCGREFLSYGLNDAKPVAANSYPANCSTSDLPDGALIVDNLPPGTASRRPGCSAVTTTGGFQFSFPGGTSGLYPGKIDVHQLGAGFNGHFYFSHVRVPGTAAAFGGQLDFSGTWTLGQTLNNKWAEVYVHMPSLGAWSQQANYVINTGGGTTTRSVNQRNYANRWVSLGTLLFNGTPSITLANNSGVYNNAESKYDGMTIAQALSGADDIAWDAVAFVPLAQKPSDFIVALGDSYSSGEGTSVPDGSEFFRGTDHHGVRITGSNGEGVENPDRNACHRSYDAWPYLIDPVGVPGAQTARSLVQAKSPLIDFQLLACSGAETRHVQAGGAGQYGELSQLDRGFLDSNTTLITMTIGGNDVGFGPVIQACITSGVANPPPLSVPCQDRSAPEALASSGTVGQAVDARLSSLETHLTILLQQIAAKAPNAKIALLGYPTLFATGSECVLVLDSDRGWLNGVADRLNQVLTRAAMASGTNVRYQSPQYQFEGSTLCAQNSGLTGIVTTLTKGDFPLFEIPVPGPDFGAPYSQQSVHPNDLGSAMYAAAANTIIRQTKIPLSATLVGGAPVTYYSTFRIHAGGPVSMNVSAFSSCGREIRIGLRRNDGSGAIGEQDTNSLSWTQPQIMQNFIWTSSATPSSDLPAGAYALNARLVDACAGGGEQPWTGALYW